MSSLKYLYSQGLGSHIFSLLNIYRQVQMRNPEDSRGGAAPSGALNANVLASPRAVGEMEVNCVRLFRADLDLLQQSLYNTVHHLFPERVCAFIATKVCSGVGNHTELAGNVSLVLLLAFLFRIFRSKFHPEPNKISPEPPSLVVT